MLVCIDRPGVSYEKRSSGCSGGRKSIEQCGRSLYLSVCRFSKDGRFYTGQGETERERPGGVL